MRLGRLFLVGMAAVLAVPSAALPPAGTPAPSWNGKTTTGKSLSSAQLKGKVVLLNFFGFF